MPPPRTAVLPRVALVGVALAVVAFLAVGLRSAVPQAEGRDIAAGELDEASYARALELFRDAQPVNPDSEADLLEGGLLLAGGSPREAAAVIEEVVRDEPENSKAWALLAAATRERDPDRAREARAQLSRIKPAIGP